MGALGREDGAGAGTLAPPAAAAWANAATGGGDLLQSGCGGGDTGCPVVGLTTSGHWQLKSSREQPKSCVHT